VTAAGEVLSVHRADVDTPCRRCGCTIARGQRVALLVAVGAVHVRCILASPPAKQSRHESEETTLTRPDQMPEPEPEPRAAVAADVCKDAWPAATTPSPAPVADEDHDDRDLPWWQR
jgi:hypothetical protein